MYHKIKVKLLSNPQISRLLNGHGVRVSDGNDHDIELSKEQLKKFMKAREKGKAITLNMDPFQMQAHQYLRVLVVALCLVQVVVLINIING
jgi:hypothetical protein